jgi:hypothetical protein
MITRPFTVIAQGATELNTQLNLAKNNMLLIKSKKAKNEAHLPVLNVQQHSLSSASGLESKINRNY